MAELSRELGPTKWDSEGEAVITAKRSLTYNSLLRISSMQHWYAVHSRSRHEKKASQQLREIGIETLLPLSKQVRKWSDRQKTVDLPLFPGYTFVKINYLSSDRLRVLQVPGVVGFVGPHGLGIPIPSEQIDSIQMLMSGQAPCQPHPFIAAGRRVRIRGGALDGIQGVLAECREDRSLVISVASIQRAVSIRVEGYDLEVLPDLAQLAS